MGEINLKTHLYVREIEDFFHVNWCGKLKDAVPVVRNNRPVFAVIGPAGRVELNTVDMKELEECAKRLAVPKGRAAITSGTSRIYIKEVGGNERLMGIVTHRRQKSYNQMFDKVGYEK